MRYCLPYIKNFKYMDELVLEYEKLQGSEE